ASATGLQLSDEIHLTGRPVTLSVGEHVRMPRTYRNRDIQWWMNVTGLLDDTIDAVDDLVRARNIPSPQLIGTTDLSTIDLNCLTDRGVELVGRIAAIQERDGTTIAQFSGSLGNVCRLADLKLNRLLKSFDEWADLQSTLEVGDPQVFKSTAVPEKPELDKNLGGKEGIKSVVWATGYKPDFQFLKLPVFDRKQRLNHEGGVVSGVSGMYVLGLTFLRRRKSSFIHGAEDDARELVEHLESFLRDSRTITDSTC
ncbi:MAG: pyridine nucleotide-disulfide oxidoreductase, partial [Gammaproteobacteria bacterium]|nr:pyridine nucleotide-disulfide oxidoreductase [Gammaproteobacteria bacterium]